MASQLTFAAMLLVLALPLGCRSADSQSFVDIVFFDGESHQFGVEKSPKSTADWFVDTNAKVGILSGQVKKSLTGPGWVKISTDGEFPDLSTYASNDLDLAVRSSTAESLDLTVTLFSGGGRANPFTAPFTVEHSEFFRDVSLPFTSFNNTDGESLTENELKAINGIEIKAQGTEGAVYMEFKFISVKV